MRTLIYRTIFAGLIVMFLAACSSTGIATPPISQLENPYAPQPSDNALVRDSVEIVKTEVQAQESYPVQFALTISFFTPTPCHQYRLVVSQPTADRKINVEVYSLMKKNQVCTLMRTLNPTQVSVNLGSLPAGHYTVWVNGVNSAEFNAQ